MQKNQQAGIRSWLAGLDPYIIIATAMLVFFGLVMVFSSTSSINAAGELANPFNQVLTQLLGVLAGTVLALVIICLPASWFSNYYLLNGLQIILNILLVVTLIFGMTVNGATSWLPIGGFSFQPSEFVKPLSIFVLSWMLVDFEREVNLSFESFKPRNRVLMGGLLLLQVLLIYLQPDRGMVAILLVTWLLMLCLSRLPAIWTSLVLAGGFIGFALMRLYFIGYAEAGGGESESYFINRFIAMGNPFRYQDASGYQLVNAFQAFSQGGLFGKGLGNSNLKDGYLPAAENDFIIAIIAEELGLVGLLAVLGVFIFLILRLFYLAAQSKYSFASKGLMGIGLLIAVQMLVNILGVIGLIPLTGVTLPFISYGGTSMMMFLSLIGLAERLVLVDSHQEVLAIQPKAQIRK